MSFASPSSIERPSGSLSEQRMPERLYPCPPKALQHAKTI